jgi:hypothetical protein
MNETFSWLMGAGVGVGPAGKVTLGTADGVDWEPASSSPSPPQEDYYARGEQRQERQWHAGGQAVH